MRGEEVRRRIADAAAAVRAMDPATHELAVQAGLLNPHLDAPSLNGSEVGYNLTEDEMETLEDLIELLNLEWGHLGPPQAGSHRDVLELVVIRWRRTKYDRRVYKSVVEFVPEAMHQLFGGDARGEVARRLDDPDDVPSNTYFNADGIECDQYGDPV